MNKGNSPLGQIDPSDNTNINITEMLQEMDQPSQAN